MARRVPKLSAHWLGPSHTITTGQEAHFPAGRWGQAHDHRDLWPHPKLTTWKLQVHRAQEPAVGDTSPGDGCCPHNSVVFGLRARPWGCSWAPGRHLGTGEPTRQPTPHSLCPTRHLHVSPYGSRLCGLGRSGARRWAWEVSHGIANRGCPWVLQAPPVGRGPGKAGMAILARRQTPSMRHGGAWVWDQVAISHPGGPLSRGHQWADLATPLEMSQRQAPNPGEERLGHPSRSALEVAAWRRSGLGGGSVPAGALRCSHTGPAASTRQAARFNVMAMGSQCPGTRPGPGLDERTHGGTNG